MSIDLKEEVRRIIQQRNLCSYMNDTKWNKLRTAMINDMPFPPPYIIKFLFEETDDETVGNASFCREDVYYQGNWHSGFAVENYFNGAFAIEWIKVRPRYLKHRGKLVEPEIINAEEEFLKILKRYSIYYEENNGVYCIYGYK